MNLKNTSRTPSDHAFLSPWRKKWQPTAVFLLGESSWTEDPGGLQSIIGCKESDRTEQLSTRGENIRQTLKEILPDRTQ